MKFDKINEMIDIIISDEYTKIYKNYYPMKNYDLAQDRFFIYNEVIDIPLKKKPSFIFKNLVTFAIDNMFKLNKQTDRLIFKLYMYKVSTAYKNEVTITLSNALEENYCKIIWYSNQ